MKVRVMAWFFASLMLLSSGVVQAAMHICPEEGVNILSDCGMHEQLPACCKKAKPAKQDSHENCCEDAYVFAVTPKFGAVEKVAVQSPAVFIIAAQPVYFEQLIAETEIPSPGKGDPPPLPFNRGLQQKCCSWII